MRYLIIRNEKTVHDVTDKAYKGLSDKTRKQAEAALLKANPGLKTFKSIRKGSIVNIPSIPDGAKKDSKNLVDPIEDNAQDVLDNIKLSEKTLARKFSKKKEDQEKTLGKIKMASKEFKKIPGGSELEKTLKKNITDSSKTNDKNLERGLDVLKLLQKTVATLER